jgi:hypothetical protein
LEQEESGFLRLADIIKILVGPSQDLMQVNQRSHEIYKKNEFKSLLVINEKTFQYILHSLYILKEYFWLKREFSTEKQVHKIQNFSTHKNLEFIFDRIHNLSEISLIRNDKLLSQEVMENHLPPLFLE